MNTQTSMNPKPTLRFQRNNRPIKHDKHWQRSERSVKVCQHIPSVQGTFHKKKKKTPKKHIISFIKLWAILMSQFKQDVIPLRKQKCQSSTNYNLFYKLFDQNEALRNHFSFNQHNM